VVRNNPAITSAGWQRHHESISPSCISESAEPIDVACDEWGSDGENLVEGSSRAFSLGSTDLSVEEAVELMSLAD
jgi:hypothetical protein